MSSLLRYGIVSFFVIMAPSLQAAIPQWTLSEAKGEVWVVTGQGNKEASRGQAVPSGMTIATGKGGRAVLVRGEEYLIVSPNSRFRVTGAEGQSTINQIFEEAGNLLFKIKKMATPHFGVETPYLAAVVKGTTFSVTVSTAGAAVQVLEGAVQVATLDGGASQLVTPGVIGMVGADARYTLKVQGGGDQVITSPNAPPSAAPVSAAVTETAGSQDISAAAPASGAISSQPLAGIDVPGIASGGANSSMEGRITSAVTANNGNVSAATGGLVTGDINSIAAATTASGTAADKAVIAEAVSLDHGHTGQGNGAPGGNSGNGNGNVGSGNNNAGGNGNLGAGNGNSGSNGNGNSSNGGNGNSGSNGNGNSGPGNNNAGGNGNGNGNSGVGNGNSGSTGNGNSSNGGNGNNGSNGNGNAGSGNNGNANGSGNGNSGGNGNGSGNAGQGNQGNGNGNGGSSGSSGTNGNGNGNGR